MLYLYVASQNIQPFSLHSLFSVALMIWCACKNKQCSVWLWCSVSQLCTTCVLRMEHRGMWSSCFTVFHGGFIHDVQPDAGGSVGSRSSYCHQCEVILQPLQCFFHSLCNSSAATLFIFNAGFIWNWTFQNTLIHIPPGGAVSLLLHQFCMCTPAAGKQAPFNKLYLLYITFY